MRYVSHRECAVLFSGSQCTWSTGGNLTFPPVGPSFAPVCCMEACGTQCTFFKLPRSPRRLRQRGGLNARCQRHRAAAMWSAVALRALEPPAFAKAPADNPVLKRSGLSAVALAKVESTVTCPRVLPAGELGSRKIPHSPAASPPGPEPRRRTLRR